jgi:Flp pilus assembly protein TadD
MWAYIRFVGRPKIAGYLLVVVFFALGLIAKPMLITLPFVLLLLDYWPLERLGTKRSLFYLLIEKVPLFAMVLASCIVTFIVQKESGAVRTIEEYGLSVRLANASISYIQYITKMIWPARLAVFYPHPGQNVSILYAVVSAILMLAVTVLILRFAKERRYLVTGWFWYLGTLLPVIGLVQVGNQAIADRYSYITLTGLFIIIAWGLPELFGKWPHRKVALWVSSLIVLSALAVCAHLQQQYWRNSITIFQHALKVTKNNYMAHFCMTPELIEQGRIEEAIWHNTEAVRIKPDYADAINSLGVSLHKAGRIDEAVSCYNRALEINPAATEAHVNLAAALVTKGEFAEAVRHYRIALKKTDTPLIRSDFAFLLVSLGRFEEAITEYRRALSAMPNDPNILNGLGCALAQTGKFDEAISLYNKALQIAPDLINIRLNLGFALSSSGKFAQAVEEYEKILLIQPQNAVAHNDLGVALSRQGKYDQAIRHFGEAVRLDPNYTAARDNLNLAFAEKLKSQDKEEENAKK